jgi:hypothetical protein
MIATLYYRHVQACPRSKTQRSCFPKRNCSVGASAQDIGAVYAPDADKAIKRAIEEFGITNPEHQARLVARRVA